MAVVWDVARCVVWQKFTDVSDILTVSIIIHRPEDGYSKRL
jgi:hypothetical protein